MYKIINAQGRELGKTERPYDRLRRRDRVLFRNPEPAGGGHTDRGR